MTMQELKQKADAEYIMGHYPVVLELTAAAEARHPAKEEWSPYCALLVLKGGVLEKSNKWHEALDCYNKALLYLPEDMEALCHKGKALMMLGRFSQAIPVFEKALTVDPNDYFSMAQGGIEYCKRQLQ
jgi:tetratricopeptide (TPR) repeat protein